MRKNWIIWKRTPFASLCELCCPILLMAVLALARLAVNKVEVGETSNFKDAKMFYPLVNGTNGTNSSSFNLTAFA